MSNRQPSSRSCFVCGRENPVGLKVRWDQHPEAGEIRGTVTVPEHFNGYPGIVHGGIVGALLDETAGRTILLDGGGGSRFGGGSPPKVGEPVGGGSPPKVGEPIGGGFDDLMVTAKLEVVYRRPTPTGVPLLLVGRLVRRSAARAEAKAELCLPDGTVTARAAVLLALPPAEIAERWAAEREHWRVD